MDHHVFGRTDLQVFSLALGTSRFGWRTGAAESATLLDLFREQGGNLVETCAVWDRDPAHTALLSAPAEHQVGRWLGADPAHRRAMVLAGRVFITPGLAQAADLPARLEANCETALRRLQTDRFDLLQVEWNDSFGTSERLLEALWPLVRQGRTLRLGASGFPAWRVAAANTTAQHAGLPPFASVQAAYSLLDPRPFEREYAELCDEGRLAFLAQAPLAASTLARKLESAQPAPSLSARPPSLHQLTIRERLVLLAHRRGTTPAQTELAWVLSHPGVTAAVIEPASPEQLTELLGAAHTRLSPEEHRLLRHPWIPAGPDPVRRRPAALRVDAHALVHATAPG
jgi:aryl-alcohol dehydrogenase-like predicted oxidoreductase